MGTSRVFNCVGVLSGDNEDLRGGEKLGGGVRRSRNKDDNPRRG